MDRRTFLTTATAGAALALTGTGTASAARTRSRAVRARTIDELRTAVAAARPGDVILLAPGTYAIPADRPILVQGRNGTDAAPITIRSETRGGAILTGPRSFTFSSSSYVTVDGFVLKQSTTLELPGSCHHLRLTRNDLQFADVEGLHWVMVRSERSKVDRNHFHHKSTVGVFLGVEGPGTDAMVRGTHVLRNYFSDHSFAGDNGGEPIRLGLSGRSLSDAGAVVEQNLFERADGDPEAISVKSTGNMIRHNTIRDSVGGIVLRHGNKSRVEGNFILAGSNGIRIYGNDHLIVNNYLERVTGSGIVLGSGSVQDHKPEDSPESRRGNDAPDRVTIALNTVLSSGTAISGESQRPLPPRDCFITDNLLLGDSGQLVSMPYLSGITFAGNILWGSASNGNIPTGYTRKDPKLVTRSNGIRALSSASPAIDAAARTYATVTNDLDGNPRTGRADVGADEYSPLTPTNRPLTREDVGPWSA